MSGKDLQTFDAIELAGEHGRSRSPRPPGIDTPIAERVSEEIDWSKRFVPYAVNPTFAITKRERVLPTVDELARALWETDEEVVEFTRTKSDEWIRTERGRFEVLLGKREQTKKIAWERREPPGSRERAEERATAVHALLASRATHARAREIDTSPRGNSPAAPHTSEAVQPSPDPVSIWDAWWASRSPAAREAAGQAARPPLGPSPDHYCPTCDIYDHDAHDHGERR